LDASALAGVQGTGEFANNAVLDLKSILIILAFGFSLSRFRRSNRSRSRSLRLMGSKAALQGIE